MLQGAKKARGARHFLQHRRGGEIRRKWDTSPTGSDVAVLSLRHVNPINSSALSTLISVDSSTLVLVLPWYHKREKILNNSRQ